MLDALAFAAALAASTLHETEAKSVSKSRFSVKQPEVRALLEKEIVILASSVKLNIDGNYVEDQTLEVTSNVATEAEETSTDLSNPATNISTEGVEKKDERNDDNDDPPPPPPPPRRAKKKYHERSEEHCIQHSESLATDSTPNNPPPLMSTTDVPSTTDPGISNIKQIESKTSNRADKSLTKHKKKKKVLFKNRWARTRRRTSSRIESQRVATAQHRVPESVQILLDLASATMLGIARNKLQSTPHLLLLDQAFYKQNLEPHISRWVLVWLRYFIPLNVATSDDLMKFLQSSPTNPVKELEDQLRSCLTDHQMKMINLAREWVGILLPFVLSATNRVTYGLLASHHIERLTKNASLEVSKNRRLTAVPFIGKDTPSESAEFAHPDVVIGLTIQAYRLQGLRQTDFFEFLHSLQVFMSKDISLNVKQRSISQQFAHWVFLAGGSIRGFEIQNFIKDDQMNKIKYGFQSGTRSGHKSRLNMLPLHLIDPDDKDHTKPFYELLRQLPASIFYYLDQLVFPEVCQHQRGRLSASGQSLGGELLFGRRIGFSGTPSSLLPVEMGKCHYERGTDGQILHTVVSPRVMSTFLLPDNWSVLGLLRTVATQDTKYSALIDCGALVTGISNREVAEVLLVNGGLPHKEGGNDDVLAHSFYEIMYILCFHDYDANTRTVVFLDDHDRAMVMDRGL